LSSQLKKIHGASHIDSLVELRVFDRRPHSGSRGEVNKKKKKKKKN